MERSYTPLNESELSRLSEEQQVVQLSLATDAGDSEQMSLLIAMLCFGRHDQMVDWARCRLDDPDDADDLVSEAFTEALRTATGERAKFEGATEGEYFAWLWTSLKRKVIDWNQRRTVPIPISSVSGNDEGAAETALEPRVEYDFVRDIQYRDARLAVMGRLSAHHREVVELWALKGMPASEIVAHVNRDDADRPEPPMTQANVHKVISRYRSNMREELGPEFLDG